MNIQTGIKKRTLGKSWKNMPYEVINGFYFVCKNKNGEECRYWMGETIEEAFKQFEKMGDKYLGQHNKFNYWIAYCSGYDIQKRLAWANRTYTEEFIDYGTY